MTIRKISAALVGLVLVLSSLGAHKATADSANISDGDDTSSVLDVHSVAISNTASAVTYLITLDNFTTATDLGKLRVLWDFNTDGVADSCLQVTPSGYGTGIAGNILESQKAGATRATTPDCSAGEMFLGSAAVTKPNTNQVSISLPLFTLRAAGLGPTAQSYGVAVDTRDTSSLTTIADRAPDGTAFTTHTLVAFKPDATIKSTKDASPVGNDVYNTDGTQSSTLKVRPKKSGVFTIAVQNDSTADDSMLVAGCATSTGFTVAFNDGADQTAPIAAGTYNTGTLASGASKVITLTITLAKSAKKSKTCDVEVTSNGNPTTQDLVRAVVKVKK